MGLDMYAYAKDENGEDEHLADWRKHNRLHGWMEELWEDDGTAKKVLSQFLDHPIDNLWKNLYSPDKGHFVEFDRDVPCQAYGQNMELTKETYIKLKEQYQKIYDDWKDYYGSLPMNWGEPLDYKFDYWHI